LNHDTNNRGRNAKRRLRRPAARPLAFLLTFLTVFGIVPAIPLAAAVGDDPVAGQEGRFRIKSGVWNIQDADAGLYDIVTIERRGSDDVTYYRSPIHMAGGLTGSNTEPLTGASLTYPGWGWGLQVGRRGSNGNANNGIPFASNQNSFWSGETFSPVETSNVTWDRAIFFRLRLPDDVDPKYIDGVDIVFTLRRQEVTNNANSIDQYVTLFALNESLPNDLRAITALKKGAFSNKQKIETAGSFLYNRNGNNDTHLGNGSWANIMTYNYQSYGVGTLSYPTATFRLDRQFFVDNPSGDYGFEMLVNGGQLIFFDTAGKDEYVARNPGNTVPGGDADDAQAQYDANDGETGFTANIALAPYFTIRYPLNEITVVKEIDKANFNRGNPTFIFKLEKLDPESAAVYPGDVVESTYRTFVFDPETWGFKDGGLGPPGITTADIKNNPTIVNMTDNSVVARVVFGGLEPGFKYRVSEIDPMRYKQIEDGVSGSIGAVYDDDGENRVKYTSGTHYDPEQGNGYDNANSLTIGEGYAEVSLSTESFGKDYAYYRGGYVTINFDNHEKHDNYLSDADMIDNTIKLARPLSTAIGNMMVNGRLWPGYRADLPELTYWLPSGAEPAETTLQWSDPLARDQTVVIDWDDEREVATVTSKYLDANGERQMVTQVIHFRISPVTNITYSVNGGEAVDIPGFSSEKLEYTVWLPANATGPVAIGAEGDADDIKQPTQPVETLPGGSSVKGTITSGGVTYTVYFKTPPISEVLFGNESWLGFNPDKKSYVVTLKYGEKVPDDVTGGGVQATWNEEHTVATLTKDGETYTFKFEHTRAQGIRVYDPDGGWLKIDGFDPDVHDYYIEVPPDTKFTDESYRVEPIWPGEGTESPTGTQRSERVYITDYWTVQSSNGNDAGYRMMVGAYGNGTNNNAFSATNAASYNTGGAANNFFGSGRAIFIRFALPAGVTSADVAATVLHMTAYNSNNAAHTVTAFSLNTALPADLATMNNVAKAGLAPGTFSAVSGNIPNNVNASTLEHEVTIPLTEAVRSNILEYELLASTGGSWYYGGANDIARPTTDPDLQPYVLITYTSGGSVAYPHPGIGGARQAEDYAGTTAPSMAGVATVYDYLGDSQVEYRVHFVPIQSVSEPEEGRDTETDFSKLVDDGTEGGTDTPIPQSIDTVFIGDKMLANFDPSVHEYWVVTDSADRPRITAYQHGEATGGDITRTLNVPINDYWMLTTANADDSYDIQTSTRAQANEGGLFIDGVATSYKADTNANGDNGGVGNGRGTVLRFQYPYSFIPGSFTRADFDVSPIEYGGGDTTHDDSGDSGYRRQISLFALDTKLPQSLSEVTNATKGTYGFRERAGQSVAFTGESQLTDSRIDILPYVNKTGLLEFELLTNRNLTYFQGADKDDLELIKEEPIEPVFNITYNEPARSITEWQGFDYSGDQKTATLTVDGQTYTIHYVADRSGITSATIPDIGNHSKYRAALATVDAATLAEYQAASPFMTPLSFSAPVTSAVLPARSSYRINFDEKGAWDGYTGGDIVFDANRRITFYIPYNLAETPDLTVRGIDGNTVQLHWYEGLIDDYDAGWYEFAAEFKIGGEYHMVRFVREPAPSLPEAAELSPGDDIPAESSYETPTELPAELPMEALPNETPDVSPTPDPGQPEPPDGDMEDG
jgi:hypothetical protein